MKKMLSMTLIIALAMILMTSASIRIDSVSGISYTVMTETVQTMETCFACEGSGHCELCHGCGWFFSGGEYTACPQRCETCGGEGYWYTAQVIPVMP